MNWQTFEKEGNKNNKVSYLSQPSQYEPEFYLTKYLEKLKIKIINEEDYEELEIEVE